MHPRYRPLPYVGRLDLRVPGAIELVVIHCTELPGLAEARSYGERVLYPDSGTGASGHYYVDRDGQVECWVEPLRVAHHTRGHNSRSIGIELVNLGRYPDWHHSGHQRMTEPYPDAQIEALLELLAALRHAFDRLGRIAGHERLDTTEIEASDDPTRRVRRKLDPGPMFPWAEVLARSGLFLEA